MNQFNANPLALSQHQTLEQHQTLMGQYLRNPEHIAAPKGLDERRAAIYSELVFNNIESQLSGAFPVICSILSTADWHALVREFVRDYRAQTPYFTQLSAEFVSFMANRTAAEGEHAFLLELAQYERVELDLYMMDEMDEKTIINPEELLGGGGQNAQPATPIPQMAQMPVQGDTGGLGGGMPPGLLA